MNNVVDTAREEGIEAGIELGIELGIEQGIEQGIELERSRALERQQSQLLRLLSRTLGELPEAIRVLITQLSSERLDVLNDIFMDFTSLDELVGWLDRLES